jgi:NADPH2:quinone reductase
MVTATNHQVVVTRHGDPDVLQVVEADIPEPGTGDVRVKVLAAGISAFDLIYRRWARLPGSPKVPFTLGEDIVGVVDKTGPGVGSLEPGLVVAGGTWALGIGGGYTEYVCLPETELVPVPPGVDPAEAACLVVNYLTAHQHLHDIGGARRGERMLVHGAAGGVGTAVVQLGQLAGLEMYGTAAKDKHELVSSLGATPIDYRSEDFVEAIRTLTGDGVDLVIDPIGGAAQLWRSYRSLRRGGRLVWLGSAAVEKQGIRVGPLSMATVFLLRLLPDGKHVPRCPTMDVYAEANPEWYRATMAELLDHLAAGRLRPIIAERIPLAEAARAHALIEKGGHTGKFVLVTPAYQRQ